MKGIFLKIQMGTRTNFALSLQIQVLGKHERNIPSLQTIFTSNDSKESSRDVSVHKMFHSQNVLSDFLQNQKGKKMKSCCGFSAWILKWPPGKAKKFQICKRKDDMWVYSQVSGHLHRFWHSSSVKIPKRVSGKVIRPKHAKQLIKTSLVIQPENLWSAVSTRRQEQAKRWQ